MAQIDRCDICGVLENAENPVHRRYRDYVHTLKTSGVEIHIEYPRSFADKDVCQRCMDGYIRSQFNAVCGLIAPYQPARVPGLVQYGGVDSTPEPMTKEDLKILRQMKKLLAAES